MNDIHISDELTVRFQNRPEEFDAGFEIGGLAALMAIPIARFTRRLSLASLRAATRLAESLDYNVVSVPDDIDDHGRETVRATFSKTQPRKAPNRHGLSIVGGMG